MVRGGIREPHTHALLQDRHNRKLSYFQHFVGDFWCATLSAWGAQMLLSPLDAIAKHGGAGVQPHVLRFVHPHVLCFVHPRRGTVTGAAAAHTCTGMRESSVARPPSLEPAAVSAGLMAPYRIGGRAEYWACSAFAPAQAVFFGNFFAVQVLFLRPATTTP